MRLRHVAFVLTASCGVFGGDDAPAVAPPSPSNSTNGGGDAGGDGQSPIVGEADLRLEIEPLPTNLRIIQGRSLKVPIKLVRGRGIRDAVTITVTSGLREGLKALPLSLLEAQGELEILAEGTVPQGPIVLELTATSSALTAKGTLHLFV